MLDFVFALWLQWNLPWETACLAGPQVFLAESATFQSKWTCHQDHLSWDNIFWLMGRYFKTGVIVFDVQLVRLAIIMYYW